MEVGKYKASRRTTCSGSDWRRRLPCDLVLVGEEGLMSEVIGISGNKHIIQVYEETGGVKPGEPSRRRALPRSAAGSWHSDPDL